MKEFEITAKVKECVYDELTHEDKELVDRAKEATLRAFAPYSHFHVGAAIRLDNGKIVAGSNQENAAYPSGLCAERTAIFYASSENPGVAVKKIAVAAWPGDENIIGSSKKIPFLKSPVSPCGGCRQALAEYEKLYGDIEVILYGDEKIYIFPSVRSLLPYYFTEF